MAKARLQEEENPDYDDSHLFHNRAIGCGAELCDANATSIEDCTCEDETDSIHKEYWTGLKLLSGYEYVISMVIDALSLVEGTREQLSWD